MKLGVTIAIIVVLGTGVWYMSVDKKQVTHGIENLKDTEVQSLADEDAVPTGNPVTGSIQELVAKGGQYTCTFTMTDSNADSTGTVYVDGKKFRGDFKSIVKSVGMTVESHSLSDGIYSYTWSNASPTGIKAPVVDTGSNDYATMSGNMNFIAQGAHAGWKCVTARHTNSVFAVPKDITFTEAPKAI